MTVRSFDFTNLDARRLTKVGAGWGNIRVDHNSTVTLITESGADAAQLDFRFTASYRAAEAVIGLIQIEGQIAWEGDAKALVKGWSAGGQMPQETAQEIHTVIMTNCLPETVILARDLRLPPPIPIPQVQVPGPTPPPKKGRSPEIA
jgi:hypothetical protein